MPLFSDATALIALGAAGQIKVLQFWPSPIVITPEVRREVRTSAVQIDSAIRHGWMHLAQPDAVAVEQLMASGRLDRGEAETIEVATRLGLDSSSILIDEARGLKYVQRKGVIDAVCLAQVLHQLERQGDLPSCQDVMESLVTSGSYRWAKRARQHYEAWCAREGLEPV
jgi:predicted nucleic acid-binding protein